MKTRCPVKYKLVNPFLNFHSPCLPHQNGCHTFMHKDSPLAPFLSHHFLILEEIWLIGEGVTTPNREEKAHLGVVTPSPTSQISSRMRK